MLGSTQAGLSSILSKSSETLLGDECLDDIYSFGLYSSEQGKMALEVGSAC